MSSGSDDRGDRTPRPGADLAGLFDSWTPQMARTVTLLGIPDHLASGPRTVAEPAAAGFALAREFTIGGPASLLEVTPG